MSYDTNDRLQLPRYMPIEAAIRWCGLLEHEDGILNITLRREPVQGHYTELHAPEHKLGIPLPEEFPQWPCLRARTLEIVRAIKSGELRARGAEDRSHHFPPGLHRVWHSDLLEWMETHHPNERPAFLYSDVRAALARQEEMEKALAKLEEEREKALAKLEEVTRELEEVTRERDALREEVKSLQASLEKSAPPNERSRTTYLNIIGALLKLMLSETPEGKPQSFENQAEIISAMLTHYGHVKGLGDSNIQKIMAEANKTLKDSLSAWG